MSLSGHRQVIGNTNSFNVRTNYNHNTNIVNFTTEAGAERQQILQWLSPLEPQQRHQGVRAERLKGVGNWVLETNEFRKWSDMEGGCVEQVLFCSGNPGVGKTYLSSLVIDSLCDQAGGEDFAVVGLYCDFLAQQEQSTASMLGAILKQLVTRGEIPEHVRGAFQKAKREFGGRSLLPPDLIELLKRTIKSLPRVYICIDALDESVPKHRQEFLELLREIVQVSPNTRIFLTGRPHIDGEIEICFGKAVKIPISPALNDIKSYLEMRLSGDTDPNAMDDELRADIMRVILEEISEIFLLVSLNVDAILGEITLHQRRQKLDEMTKGEGLGDAYAATLSRVQAQQKSRSKLGMEVLMWVSHAERPLHVDELCHALGVEKGSMDLNIRNVPAIETVLACSMGLVTVEKSSSTVRLIHYTLQEYLSLNPNLFLKPHSMIAEACLTYLNLQQVRGISATLWKAPPAMPLVHYASCHWGTHARRETTESVKTLALTHLDGYDKHISSKMLLLHEMCAWEWDFDDEGTPRGFTGLHGAAFLGCEEITIAMLEVGRWDVQATDFCGNTAISWAARRGYEGVVRILLERSGVNPNTVDTRSGRTPLSWAAVKGYEGVVRILLERNDVNPNTVDTQSCETSLSLAAKGGHEGVVRMLLERGEINPDKADNRGRTPLSWAAKNGHEEVVRILLERNDVDSSTADTPFGRTPLSLAAEGGHEGVVRMLLERGDINPDTADNRSRTPLSWAAKNGHGGIVRILLERNDVDSNIAETLYGRTPLSLAAEGGHEEVVEILLERSDINPDKADNQSQTPLSLAAENGHGGVVRLLLERNDINPDTADNQRRTPLSLAAKNGYGDVVRMMLERNDVDSNTADTKYGRTPLSWAAANGHEGVLRILMERGINPDTTGTLLSQKPLLLAAQYGHEGVVRILLERGDINPDTADIWRRTPLSFAAENGHGGIVRILLERNDVDCNTADTIFSRTPLSLAAERGHEGVVGILLERRDINPDTADNRRRTPLSWAAEKGHGGVVRMLLERNDVESNTADLDGLTPLQRAIRNRYTTIAKLLQERTHLEPRYSTSSQLAQNFSPEPSEPAPKKVRRF